MTSVIRNTQKQVHDPDQLPPYPRGLYAHVDWLQDGGTARFLLEDGVVIRPANFNAEIGAWDKDWCVDPDTLTSADWKLDERAAFDEDHPFLHDVVYGADRTFKGNLREEERQRARDRALNNILRLEQVVSERTLADRMIADITTYSITTLTATSPAIAIAKLEDAAAETGVGGLQIHGKPYWASIYPDGFTESLETKVGHLQYVAGGGYVQGLTNRLVLTSPVQGWRSDLESNEALKLQYNQFIAVAERSVLLGYEKIVATVTIS